MGFGLPAAIGAAFARPGETIVCVAGDGSIQMNIQELATIYKHQLPIVIAITNNGMLGMVRQWQEMFHAAALLRGVPRRLEPRLRQARRGVRDRGAQRLRPRDRRALIPEAMAAKKPVLINFVVYESEKVFPMVPAGAGVDEMIIGDQEADEARGGDRVSRARPARAQGRDGERPPPRDVGDGPRPARRARAHRRPVRPARVQHRVAVRRPDPRAGHEPHHLRRHRRGRRLEQMQKQLQKLIDVIKVIDHSDGPYVDRELMLIKVAVRNARRPRRDAPDRPGLPRPHHRRRPATRSPSR
jgi:hypothetical protein